jgi:HEAT repeat protein
MMQRPRANEIPALIRGLGSRSRTRVDSSKARLTIIGARAVEDLIEALEGDNNRVRAQVMPLLAMIQDSRGREPLIAMLLDRNAQMRLTAVRCLARFPSPDSTAALNRVLQKDPDEQVKIATVQSLVELYSAGQEGALRTVLELLYDVDEAPTIRIAAFSLLRALRPGQRRSILKRLRQDTVAEVRDKAGGFEVETVALGELEDAELRGLVVDLASDDYAVWNDAVQRLGVCGAAVVQPLVGEMRRRSNDPEYCTRAGMVLKGLGPRRGRALADALEQIEEPVPLHVLVEVIGTFGEKALIYRLKDLIERISPQTPAGKSRNAFDLALRVRAKAHLELARIGSRVAIQDLRDALAESDRRIDLELLAAVGLIGKREELALLLRAYNREDNFTKRKIAEVVRMIMKRERIRRNNPMFQTLGPERRRALESILPPTTQRGRRTRPAASSTA